MKIASRLLAVSLALATFTSLAPAQTIVYDNTTTFQLAAATNGGVTSNTGTRQTFLLLDDLTYNPALTLTNVTQIIFSLANLNSTSQALTPFLRIYNSDGTGGGPGTLITGFNFNPITIAANNVNTLTFNVPAASQFLLPTSGTIWMGLCFSSSTQTAAVMNNFGMGLFDPPTVGTSQDRDFLSSTTTTQTTSNPTGAIRTSPFTAAPAANYGFRLTVAAVPEPGSVALMAVGGVGLLLGAGGGGGGGGAARRRPAGGARRFGRGR